MRPLSRLLSVFLALILMGLSVATVSGHAEDANNIPKVADLVSVEVVLNSDVETASPGDALKFQVTVLRVADGHTVTGVVNGPDDAEDIAEFTLNDASPIKTMEVSYTIQAGDLGADAAERTADLVWTFDASALANEDTTLAAHTFVNDTNDKATGSVEVALVKRAAADGGILGITLDFSDTTEPDSLAKGEKVTFKLVVTTGDTYSLPDLDGTAGAPTTWKSLVVTRQLYDAEGDKVGNAVPSAVFTIPSLETGSTSNVLESAPKTHALQTAEADEIADGGKLVFSYVLTVNEADIRKGAADGTVSNANNDLNKDEDTLDKIVDLKDDILTLEMAAPEAEATPEPPVGMTDSATVTKLEGNAIQIDRHDGGVDFNVGVGLLSADGMLSPHASGYIRDSDLGQTYAVANRESDGMIVRVWISSSSPHVSDIDWSAVLDFYNVPKDVVNAIPLDHTAPAANQLVDAGGTWYVYTGGAWRHIPDIPTFQSRGYYYCDLTTATADWADSITPGQALPSVGGEEDPDYPVCR